MAAALAGLAVLSVAAGAQAHDQKRWKHHGRHFVPPGHAYHAPVIVYRAPVYYERAPVYYEPTYYYPPPPPGLNLNFNVPLR
jgi:hypothetical protein